MNIQPVTPIRTSEYANRDNSIRNVCYYVERKGNFFLPVVYGKTREPEESPWVAMNKAKQLANKIAGALRDKGIRARSVQIHNMPV